MPSFSITRRERTFAGAVNDTISERPRVRKPKVRAARASSVARPPPQNGRARRHATSTQGVKAASKDGIDNPTTPMNGATPGVRPPTGRTHVARSERPRVPSPLRSPGHSFVCPPSGMRSCLGAPRGPEYRRGPPHLRPVAGQPDRSGSFHSKESPRRFRCLTPRTEAHIYRQLRTRGWRNW
jgi:hypothetical protein